MIKAVMVLKNGGRGVLLGITDRNIEFTVTIEISHANAVGP